MDEEELLRQAPGRRSTLRCATSHDVEAAWQLIEARQVAYITTDHVGWTRERKTTRSNLRRQVGSPRWQVFLPLFLRRVGRSPDFSVGRLAELLRREIQRAAWDLWPQKGGSSSRGADSSSSTPDAALAHRRGAHCSRQLRWSPYHGREVTGAMTRVFWCGAKKSSSNGQLTGAAGHGGWACGPSRLSPTVGWLRRGGAGLHRERFRRRAATSSAGWRGPSCWRERVSGPSVSRGPRGSADVGRAGPRRFWRPPPTRSTGSCGTLELGG